MTSALDTEAKFACDFKLGTRLTASKLSLVSTRYRGIADVGGGILNGSKGSEAACADGRYRPGAVDRKMTRKEPLVYLLSEVNDV